MQLPPELNKPQVFVIATAHSVFRDIEFPLGSVVIDPWGMIPRKPGIEVIRIGRKS